MDNIIYMAYPRNVFHKRLPRQNIHECPVHFHRISILSAIVETTRQPIGWSNKDVIPTTYGHREDSTIERYVRVDSIKRLTAHSKGHFLFID